MRVATQKPLRPGEAARCTLRALLTDAARRLHAAAIDNPRLEARLLLGHAYDLSLEDLLRDPDVAADPALLEPLLQRRLMHEPLAYILGHREFWSLDFAVSPATLIPRPDSETLIEAAIEAFAGRAPPSRVLDLGTGTGCLLLAALHEFPAATGVGVDRSPVAARLAGQNAASLGMADRAAFLCADWDTALAARFDLVLSNPPYIPTSDVLGLQSEVARFEPLTALDGGIAGLDAYIHIIPRLSALLQPNGVGIVELGIGLAAPVLRLAASAGLDAAVRDDLAGVPRAVVLRRMAEEKTFGTTPCAV